MPPEIFTHIEGYEFRELLGQGGFGSVCKAIDRLGRDVAIKVLALTREEGDQKEASNRAFLREAKVLAQLNHPNIVTIYSFDIDSSGQPYLVMEFLPGEPLSRIIRSGRQLHLVEKISIILQAAKALQFAHNAKPQPIIHRDIKPHNLMVMPDLTVKLIDFGIAQVGGIKSRSMNNVVGSLPYMSPEHWQLPLTPWGDVFSLGVVFFELLTGSVPFATEQDSVSAAYQKIASDTPAPPLKQFLRDVPGRLEEVMAKVLSKTKSTGYEDAQQFWSDLSRVHNSIRPQFIAEGLERAIAAKNAGDYETASDLAQKLLGVDRENQDVRVLQSEINQVFHRKERSLKVRSICERVEEALISKKFDLAQLGLDEAMQLDPGGQIVALLNQRLRLARELYAKIEVLISNAEKHKQAGHWNDALQLVGEALALDRTNTLALRLHSQIGEMQASEHQLCVDARLALDQLRFQDAFQIILQAERIAPNSERVKALKEYAVAVHREQMVRQEVETAFLSAQRLYEANDLSGASRELRSAIAKYPDQKKLLGLRDAVELKLVEAQRERAVQELCASAECDCVEGHPEAALARLEKALLRFPRDSRLEAWREQARTVLARQESEKRRAQYSALVRNSLHDGNPSAALVTLEMALQEYPDDSEFQMLLGQARAAGEILTHVQEGQTGKGTPRHTRVDPSATHLIGQDVRISQTAPNVPEDNIYRYPSIEILENPCPGEIVHVAVNLLVDKPVNVTGSEMVLKDLDPGWTELVVAVRVASNWIIFDSDEGSIVIRPDTPSVPFEFAGRVREDATGILNIVASFFFNARYCGSSKLVTTLQCTQGPTMYRSLGAAAKSADPECFAISRQGTFQLEISADTPMLTVRIVQPDGPTSNRQIWFFEIAAKWRRTPNLPNLLRGEVDLGSTPEIYVQSLYKEFEVVDRGKHVRCIQGFGENLFDVAPSAFQQMYRALRTTYGDGFPIQFITDEPYIPWELMRPTGLDNQSPCLLAESHPVARWISAYESTMPPSLPEGSIVTVAPDYAGRQFKGVSVDVLKHAAKESSMLVRKFGAMQLDGSSEAFIKLLEEKTGPTIAILHFAGHGRFGDIAATSEILFVDGTLGVLEIRREEVNLGKRCQTLVIFNACQVGASGSALGKIAGWAEAFLRSGFSGFIAPLWSVHDGDALTVTKELFDDVVAKKQPPAHVLQRLRKKYGACSPTFLSYLYYGDVMAKQEQCHQRFLQQ